jgi:hypothetical protein
MFLQVRVTAQVSVMVIIIVVVIAATTGHWVR